MEETGTGPATMLQFRQDIEAQFRRHIRGALDVALAEELAAARGSDRHERTDRRRGYRNGTLERTITTPDGTRTITVPRGRVVSQDGATTEYHSQLLPRYARRTRETDDAILGCYLVGINSRRIRTALKPLLGERHLSKSAVSRIVGRLKALFTSWQDRDLSAERSPIVFLDGFHVKVRVAGRVVSVPVLAKALLLVVLPVLAYAQADSKSSELTERRLGPAAQAWCPVRTADRDGDDR